MLDSYLMAIILPHGQRHPQNKSPLSRFSLPKLGAHKRIYLKLPAWTRTSVRLDQFGRITTSRWVRMDTHVHSDFRFR